jgi:hypothetical protein
MKNMRFHSVQTKHELPLKLMVFLFREIITQQHVYEIPGSNNGGKSAFKLKMEATGSPNTPATSYATTERTNKNITTKTPGF